MPLYSIDGIAPELPPDGSCYIAPDAVLIGRVRLLKNASVWFGAVLRGDNDWITIGENSNVQDNAVIHADPGLPVVIGTGVTVGHRAIIHSATVGNHSVIGAGALVAEDKEFADGSLALGAPARLIRTLDGGQRGQLERAADIYVANAWRYREGLKEIPPVSATYGTGQR